ncbi:MAG TPA: GHKL domain-containing protein, partial [Candidatus Mediterraneibacter gallistercoris]|nr:GHKL domain-containing protein [Candidatus Mediterraneibacter gallistercoris]
NYKMQAEINRLQTDYALQIDENLKILRSVRHDIKNHLIIIDGYAAQKKFEKIHEYISRIGDRFKDTAPIQTSSTAVSAILNEKSALAQQKNISCEITCDFLDLKVDDFTMITILGNLLDNAITAASKCADGWIRANLQQQDSLLTITIDNSHAEEIREKDGVFTSTKTGKPNIHGIGIKNVRKAVSDLRGQIDINYTGSTFHIGIVLPNYK